VPKHIVGRGERERGGEPQRLHYPRDLDGGEGVPLQRPAPTDVVSPT
jgi:hypothetical protein